MKSFREQGEQIFEKLARTLFVHRFKTLALVLVLFVALASNLGKLTMDVTTEGFLHKEDPSLVSYEAFKEQFGNDDLIIIAVESDRVFTLDFFNTLGRLHRELESKVPYLDDITSLVNVRNTFGKNDTLYVRDLCDPFPGTQEEVNQIRELVFSNPLYRDLVISKDGKTTSIVIELMASTEMDDTALMAGFEDQAPASTRTHGAQRKWLTVEQNAQAVEMVSSIVDAHRDKDFKISLSGTACVNHFLKEILQVDTARFMKLAYFGVMVFLALMFRRITGVLAPVLIVTLSLVSALSLMALTGVSFKLPTQIMPSFILAVGVGYSVHILALFYNRLKEGKTRQEAIAYAMGHSGVAVVLTAMTTAAGLFSFSGSEVAPTAELGIFAGAGVFFAMIYTFLLLPPILSFAKIPKTDKVRSHKAMDSFLAGIARISTTYPGLILGVSSLLLLGACLGIPRLNFSHDVLRWLPDTEEIRLDSERIDRLLKGTVNMEVIIDTGRENGLYDPDFLRQIEEASHKIAAIETDVVSTGKVWSILEILRETHKALHNNDPQFYALPDNRDLTAQELFLFEGSGSDDLEDFTDAQLSKARVSVKVPFIDAISYTRYIDRVNEILEAELPGVSVTTTGMVIIYSQVIAAGIHSMGQSYILAFATITLMMIILLGNLRMGILAMLPNLMPIIIILGLAGWLGLPVSLFIMLVGNIAMGLAVDDTIHFMHNFKKYLGETQDVSKAVTRTLVTVGRPMVVTTVVLSMGFFIYLFSEMNHLTHFGLLTGFAIILALAADFFLAPALVTLVYRTKQVKTGSRVAEVGLPAIFLGLALVSGLAATPAEAKAGAKDETAARTIMEAVDQRYDGDDRTSDVTMVLVDKNQNRRVRQMKSFSKDEGENTWSAMFFLSPVDVRDTGFLSYDIDKTTDDDQWLYLPALHKVKRIASDDKTASFMGSDFSYADMTDRELELYDFSILKEDKVRGHDCWIINSIPRTPKVIKDFGYTRSILFVRKDCHIVVRAIHFVQEGNKLKYLDIPRLKEIDGIWTPLEIHVTTKKGKKFLHKTIMTYANVVYNQNLSDNMFTTRKLEKGVN